MSRSRRALVDATSARVGRWGIFFAAWIALSVVAGAWALASPISSGPDEPAHFIKAASVARGQLVGPQGEHGNEVLVPKYVAWSLEQDCFAFHRDLPADCASEVEGDAGEMVVASTSAGYYNPVYYALVGWPTLLLGDQTGLYAMRLVSGVLSSGLLALSFMLISTWRRRTLPLLGLLAASTPMVLYVNGVLNPSAFEIAGTLTAFVAMSTIITQRNERLLVERTAVLVIAAVLAVMARSVSPLWVALALFAPLLLHGWRESKTLLVRRSSITAASAVAVAAVIALAWNPLSTAIAGTHPVTVEGAEFPDAGRSPLYGFVKTFMLTLTNASDMVGNFGWMDTPVPGSVVMIWSMLLGALLLAACSILRGRRALFAVVLFASALLLPAIIQAGFITTGGYIWQGRYGLPIFVMFIFGLAAAVGISFEHVMLPRPPLRRLLIVASVGWVVGQGYSFLDALRRYVVGGDAQWKRMLTDPPWVPPGGVVAVIALFAVGVLSVALLCLYVQGSGRSDSVMKREERDATPS